QVAALVTAPLEAATRARGLDLLAAGHAAVLREEPALVAELGVQGFALLVMGVANLLGCASIGATQGITPAQSVLAMGRRDRAMGENLIRLARDIYPGERIIGWLQTGHGSRGM